MLLPRHMRPGREKPAEDGSPLPLSLSHGDDAGYLVLATRSNAHAPPTPTGQWNQATPLSCVGSCPSSLTTACLWAPLNRNIRSRDGVCRSSTAPLVWVSRSTGACQDVRKKNKMRWMLDALPFMARALPTPSWIDRPAHSTPSGEGDDVSTGSRRPGIEGRFYTTPLELNDRESRRRAGSGHLSCPYSACWLPADEKDV